MFCVMPQCGQSNGTFVATARFLMRELHPARRSRYTFNEIEVTAEAIFEVDVGKFEDSNITVTFAGFIPSRVFDTPLNDDPLVRIFEGRDPVRS
jgi:hypothetical protein